MVRGRPPGAAPTGSPCRARSSAAGCRGRSPSSGTVGRGLQPAARRRRRHHVARTGPRRRGGRCRRGSPRPRRPSARPRPARRPASARSQRRQVRVRPGGRPGGTRATRARRSARPGPRRTRGRAARLSGASRRRVAVVASRSAMRQLERLEHAVRAAPVDGSSSPSSKPVEDRQGLQQHRPLGPNPPSPPSSRGTPASAVARRSPEAREVGRGDHAAWAVPVECRCGAPTNSAIAWATNPDPQPPRPDPRRPLSATGSAAARAAGAACAAYTGLVTTSRAAVAPPGIHRGRRRPVLVKSSAIVAITELSARRRRARARRTRSRTRARRTAPRCRGRAAASHASTAPGTAAASAPAPGTISPWRVKCSMVAPAGAGPCPTSTVASGRRRWRRRPPCRRRDR